MKRLAAKKPPPPGQKRPKKEGDELADIWGSTPTHSKRQQQFKDFTKKSIINVKGVILPTAGQSFNPSAKDHHQTLKKVIKEEENDIERQYKDSLAYRLDAAKQAIAATNPLADSDVDSDDEASEVSSSDSDQDEFTQKPVDR